MTRLFAIAHLSDVHLAPLPAIPWRAFNAKRAFGAANWTWKRRNAHLADAANAVRTAIRARNPDHIVLSGDLTNLGLPSEVARARDWLRQLGTPDTVSLVPGNHDLYVPEAAPAALHAWSAYMTSDQAGIALGGRVDGFPYVRVLVEPESDGVRGVALIGVNSAEPRPLFNASGAVGEAQRNHLAALLDRLAPRYMRVIVIHHPPLPGLGRKRSSPQRRTTQPTDPMAEQRHIEASDRKRGLNDAQAFAQLLATAGAELVLHGHNHRDMLNYATGPHGEIPIVGARSASLAHPHAGEDEAGYTWIELDRAPEGSITIKPHAVAWAD